MPPSPFVKHDPHRRPHPVVERKNERRPMKPKAWSHQDELKSLIGKRIDFMIAQLGSFTGTLVAADAYTIKVHIDAGNVQSVMTYFKSALIGYEESK